MSKYGHISQKSNNQNLIEQKSNFGWKKSKSYTIYSIHQTTR